MIGFELSSKSKIFLVFSGIFSLDIIHLIYRYKIKRETEDLLEWEIKHELHDYETLSDFHHKLMCINSKFVSCISDDKFFINPSGQGLRISEKTIEINKRMKSYLSHVCDKKKKPEKVLSISNVYYIQQVFSKFSAYQTHPSPEHQIIINW